MAFINKHILEDTFRTTYLGNAIRISRVLLLPIVLVVGVIIILIFIAVLVASESASESRRI